MDIAVRTTDFGGLLVEQEQVRISILLEGRKRYRRKWGPVDFTCVLFCFFFTELSLGRSRRRGSFQ